MKVILFTLKVPQGKTKIEPDNHTYKILIYKKTRVTYCGSLAMQVLKIEK